MVSSQIHISSIVIIILLGSSLYVSAIATAQVDFFAGKDPIGQSLESWAIKYWQWWIALPQGFENNPCLMYSVPGAPMVFLINPWTIEYQGNCTITSDKYILIPLLIGECDPTVPGVKTGQIEELWKCAQAADEPFESWDVVLDDKVITRNWGNEVLNPNLIRDILVRNSAQFTIEIPESNHLDIEAGSYPAVVDGYYLVLKPLAPGEHILKYQINQKKVGSGLANVPTLLGGSVTYNLHVR